MINTLLTFAIFSTLPMVLLWACYKGVLSKCNYSFGFNRVFIIAGLLAIVAWFALGWHPTSEHSLDSMSVANTAVSQATRMTTMSESEAVGTIPTFAIDSSLPDFRHIIAMRRLTSKKHIPPT